MPKFHMPTGSINGAGEFAKLSEFAQGYVEAMFFTIDKELDHLSFEDLAQETVERIERDCTSFLAGLPKDGRGRTLLDLAKDYAPKGYDDAQAGRDFWFTRNGHGVGFWDRGLGQVGKDLTDAAHAFGALDLYHGDDGRLYYS